MKLPILLKLIVDRYLLYLSNLKDFSIALWLTSNNFKIIQSYWTKLMKRQKIYTLYKDKRGPITTPTAFYRTSAR